MKIVDSGFRWPPGVETAGLQQVPELRHSSEPR